MADDNLYELLGRKQELLENMLQEYRNLLRLVECIKSGEVDTKLIVVQGDTWQIVEPNGTQPDFLKVVGSEQ